MRSVWKDWCTVNITPMVRLRPGARRRTRFSEALDVLLRQVRAEARARAEPSEVSALAVKEEQEKLGSRQDMRATPWVR